MLVSRLCRKEGPLFSPAAGITLSIFHSTAMGGAMAWVRAWAVPPMVRQKVSCIFFLFVCLAF